MNFRPYISLLFLGCLFAQSASVQTIARADAGKSAAQVPNGYYNIVASQSNGWKFTVSSFQDGGMYLVKGNMDNGGTWNNIGSITANPGTAFSFTVTETAVNAASNISVASGNQIFFQVLSYNGDGSVDGQVAATVTSGYNGTNSFYVDKTAPVVSSVDDEYVKSGDRVTVTGSGFATPGNATQQIKVGGNSFNIVGVANDNTLTFDVGAGNFKDVIIVTDLAGNQNSSGAELTVDNLAPVLSSVNENSLKDGGTATITGSGFKSAPASPIASLTINNSSTGVGAFLAESDTDITLTASTGNVAHSVIKVTDESGNSSTATNVKIAIDNTAPVISSITDTDGNAKSLGKSGDQIEIRGSGFVLTG